MLKYKNKKSKFILEQIMGIHSKNTVQYESDDYDTCHNTIKNYGKISSKKQLFKVYFNPQLNDNRV